ncbi:MAG: hypothetical protein WCJ56_08280 [bacterium]
MNTDPLAKVIIDPATVIGTPGHIRVGRATNGRWWLLRHDNKPFLYRGVCALWMPADYTGGEAHQYRVLWEEKNGKNTDGLVRHCLDIIQASGFNALGEWATEQFWNRGLPFTILIPIREVRIESNITPGIPDIFDPLLRQAFDARCRITCSSQASSTELVGYYVDNEGSWGTMRRDFVWGQDTGPIIDHSNVIGKERLLLQIFLAADAKHPGALRAWEWVKARHGGNNTKVFQDWGITCNSPEEFRALDAQGLKLASKNYWDDHVAFTAFYVREYFRFTAETIRRYDPNHLLLGARFGGPPGMEMLQALDRRHIDILSWNCYQSTFYERCEELSVSTGMPQLNGEFSWASGHFLDWDRLMKLENFTAEEIAHCRKLGQATLEKAITHPNLVGYTWYKFCCNSAGPDQPHCGLIDAAGTESRFNSVLLSEINSRLEGIAVGTIQPKTD